MVMSAYKFLFFTFLISIACEERIDLVLSSEDTGLLVVEGVLTNENKNHMIRLSIPHMNQNGTPQPATGASVYVFEDTIGSVLTEFPAGSGEYYTPVRRAASGKMYTLYIVYNGMQYFAQDTPRPVQPLENLRYIETATGYALTLDESGEDPYYIEHIITWANTAACTSIAACEARLVFYDLKTIDVNEIYKPEKAPFHFPRQSLVIRKKYSVSPAYKTFLRSMLSETDWRGGVFDVQRSDVHTNLSKGAVGFFAVCSVVSDSTIVQ
jgi:hypothetical protein